MIRIDNGTIRVGVETRCGGTVAEIVIGGQNLINNFDCTGRQVQAALYDGNAWYDSCAGCTGVWGWDPVQGGDKYNAGSPVLLQESDAQSIHILTRPLEWNPDDKGGGAGRPVSSDVSIEEWVSFVAADPHAVRLHYKITHLGSDTHANTFQEFPAVYVNRGYDHFIYYTGTLPWTGGPVTVDALPSGRPKGHSLATCPNTGPRSSTTRTLASPSGCRSSIHIRADCGGTARPASSDMPPTTSDRMCR